MENRLIAITGARGTGKTTMILQHIKQNFGETPKEVLYVSLDNIYFSNNRLLDLAHNFEQMGGKYLFLDEVHKSWKLAVMRADSKAFRIVNTKYYLPIVCL